SGPQHNRFALVSDASGKLRVDVYDLTSGENAGTLPLPGDLLNLPQTNISPDGRAVAVRASAAGVNLWSVADQRQLLTDLTLPRGVAVAPRGGGSGAGYCLGDQRLLTGADEGDVEAWVLPDMQPLYRVPSAMDRRLSGLYLKPHEGIVLDAAQNRLAVF